MFALHLDWKKQVHGPTGDTGDMALLLQSKLASGAVIIAYRHIYGGLFDFSHEKGARLLPLVGFPFPQIFGSVGGNFMFFQRSGGLWKSLKVLEHRYLNSHRRDCVVREKREK